ncbi:MAG: flagellar motor protein [Betaproteobacteria bacterium]|nr:flagellar motor protein [Betaproteobacteria bacterium]
MDKLSIFGMLLGIGAIVGGQIIEGGHISSLIQPAAFIIVVGGTFGAVLLQSSMATFVAGMRMIKWVVNPPETRHNLLIARVVKWSNIARKEGLLSLEGQVNALSDAFERRGLQMLVDGIEPDRLRDLLEIETDAYEAQLKLSAKVWESAGGYSPTIGILGAVMGLIQVMENLSDPSKLGSGIAVAFVATIYGVGLANLVFLPIAKKLLANINHLVVLRLMFIDGMIGIANGDNPRVIESRMEGYVA